MIRSVHLVSHDGASPKETAESIRRVERGISAIRAGHMVILTDDEDRENEGDLVMAAEKVRPVDINFMTKYGRGLICLSVTEERARKLNLNPMVQDNQSQFGTAFTVSIEAARGVSTGISAKDRARTIRVAVAPEAKPSDLVRPGHIFPVVARDGGVLVRTGQTEGSVDLARLAGLAPAGVICEVMNEDGTMARSADLKRVATKHNLVLLSVADVIRYRVEREHLVRRIAEAEVPIAGLGRFTAVSYESEVDGRVHVAAVKGDVATPQPVLARVHASCPMGDLLGFAGCDCGAQLKEALRRIDVEGRGVLVYLQKDDQALAELKCPHAAGRAVQGTREARFREYGVGAQILRDLGVRRIRLLTNNPRKIVGLHGFGLSVVERVPIETERTKANARYLERKRALGHLLGRSRRIRPGKNRPEQRR
jgi:3,4-dihydroxy 2-butanone 4-phosphate synthase / GTP cyclohydrolase II